MKSVSHKLRTGLLELRTNRGSLYATPSFYERLYLLWIFRNFHSLTRRVLTQRQQRFVDRLAESATKLEGGALHRPCLIGTVEDVGEISPRSKAATVSTPKLVELPARKPISVIAPAVGSEGIAIPRKQSKGGGRELQSSGDLRASIAEFPKRAGAIASIQKSEEDDSRQLAIRERKWPRWASVAASTVALLGVLFYLAELRTPLTSAGFKAEETRQVESGSPHLQSSQASPAAKAPASLEVRTVASEPAVTPLPKSEANTRAKVEVAKASMLKLESSSSPRVQIPGAPDHGLTYPETPDPNLTGVVNLRAVIAADGSVKEVTVLDGRRALGAAAARAVRHWRYRPAESQGQAVEAETTITFRFVGDDAVSVSFPAASMQKQN
jgi:periplasmic protein TonB